MEFYFKGINLHIQVMLSTTKYSVFTCGKLLSDFWWKSSCDSCQTSPHKATSGTGGTSAC